MRLGSPLLSTNVVLLALVASVLVTAPAREATLLSQTRHVMLDQTVETIGYGCYVGTTPSCPVSLGLVPTLVSESTVDTLPVSETVILGIGDASQDSTLSSLAFDLSGAIDLFAITPDTYCFEPWPACINYSVETDFHEGDGESFAEIQFELAETTTVSLVGSFSVSTNPYNYESFFQDPVGVFHLEVLPSSGPAVYDRLESLSFSAPSITDSIDETLVLSPGIYTLRVQLMGGVTSNQLPGSGGSQGTDVDGQYDLQVSLASPVPATGVLGKLVLGLFLATGALGAAARSDLVPQE